MRPESQEPSEQSKLEELTENFKAYINTIYELNRLKTINKLSSITGDISVYFVLLFLLMLIISLISIGTAIWISRCLNSSFSGFFIVAGFYVLVCVLIFTTKAKLIKTPVSNAIIKGILND